MQKETIVQHGTWRPFFLGAGRELRREIWYRSLSSSFRTKASTPAEDGDLRLSTSPDWLEPEGGWLRFPESHPVISPLENQRRVTHLQPSPANAASITASSLKPIRSFEQRPPCSPCMALQYIILSPLQTPTFQCVWPHWALGTRTCLQQQWHGQVSAPDFVNLITDNWTTARFLRDAKVSTRGRKK